MTKGERRKKRRDLKCHLVPYHGTQTWRIAATYSSLTSFTTFCSVSLATRAKQEKCFNLWCFRPKVIFSILTKLEMAFFGIWSENYLDTIWQCWQNTLFETENEWQKTKLVPIPLPRASRNFPDVKTRNSFFFHNWTLEIIPFIRFGIQMDWT